MDDDLRTDETKWTKEFAEIIKLARSIRRKIFDDGAAEEFRREAGVIAAKAGLTPEEAERFIAFVLDAVMQENHA